MASTETEVLTLQWMAALALMETTAPTDCLESRGWLAQTDQ